MTPEHLNKEVWSVRDLQAPHQADPGTWCREEMKIQPNWYCHDVLSDLEHYALRTDRTSTYRDVELPRLRRWWALEV